jgi:hypothetical protein
MASVVSSTISLMEEKLHIHVSPKLNKNENSRKKNSRSKLERTPSKKKSERKTRSVTQLESTQLDEKMAKYKQKLEALEKDKKNRDEIKRADNNDSRIRKSISDLEEKPFSTPPSNKSHGRSKSGVEISELAYLEGNRSPVIYK